MNDKWKNFLVLLLIFNSIGILYLLLIQEDSLSQKEFYRAYEATVEITITSDDGKEIHGTGFILDDSGLIVTNKHVVVNEQTDIPYNVIEINIPSLDLFLQANLTYSSEEDDIAFLQINCDKKLAELKLVNMEEIRLGESIFCIGNVQGTGLAVYFGNIASNIRIVEYGNQSVQAIQMDLGIYPGMSGGPILNMNGDVVGILPSEL